MEFNGKCKAPHLRRNNPEQHYRLDTNCLESSFAEKDLEVLVVSKLSRTSDTLCGTEG